MADAATLGPRVWGETHGLAAAPGSEADLDWLHAVVAHLLRAGDAALPGREEALPSVGHPDRRAVSQASKLLETIAEPGVRDGAFGARSLPARAALWEVDGRNQPIGVLPREVAWIGEDGTPAGDYVTEVGSPARRLRLFVSARAGAGRRYVSGYTGTGLARAEPARRWYRNPAWWIGIVGAAVFLVALGNILHAGRSVAQARDLFLGQQPERAVAFARLMTRPTCADDAATSQACKITRARDRLDAADRAVREAEEAAHRAPQAGRQQAAQAAEEARGRERVAESEYVDLTIVYLGGCLDTLKQPAARPVGWGRVALLDCQRGWRDAVTFASRHLIVQPGRTEGSTVGDALAWASHHAFGLAVPPAAASRLSLVMAVVAMLGGLGLLFVALGLGFTGKALGIFINAQGRYSLAVGQAVFWNWLVLTTLLGIAVFNAGLMAEGLANLPADGTANAVFPSVPYEIWLVLGLAVGSPLVSSLILRAKRPVPEEIIPATPPAAAGEPLRNTVAVRPDAVRASLADWFLGESGSNHDRLDISRIQMVVITAGLLVVYGAMVFAAIGDLALTAVLAAADGGRAAIPRLPPVGTEMAGLLALSHGAYLVVKTTP